MGMGIGMEMLMGSGTEMGSGTVMGMRTGRGSWKEAGTEMGTFGITLLDAGMAAMGTIASFDAAKTVHVYSTESRIQRFL